MVNSFWFWLPLTLAIVWCVRGACGETKGACGETKGDMERGAATIALVAERSSTLGLGVGAAAWAGQAMGEGGIKNV